MVQGNRIYCCVSSAALMRQGLVQALHHTAHRSAFQKTLIQQPLMRNVLADLAVEAEAALALALRIARAMDEGGTDEGAAALARIGTAVGKYWNCKRAPGHIFEAHGVPRRPRLYRGLDHAAPLPRGAGQQHLGRLGQRHVPGRAARHVREEAAVPAFWPSSTRRAGQCRPGPPPIDGCKRACRPEDLECAPGASPS